MNNNEINYISRIYQTHNSNFDINTQTTNKELVLDNTTKQKIQKLENEIRKLQDTIKTNDLGFKIFFKYVGRNATRFFDLDTRLETDTTSIGNLDLVIELSYSSGDCFIPIDLDLEKGLIFLQKIQYKIDKNSILIKVLDVKEIIDLVKEMKNIDRYGYYSKSLASAFCVPTKYIYYKLYGEQPIFKSHEIRVCDLLNNEKIYKLNVSLETKEQLLTNAKRSIYDNDNICIQQKDKTINMLYYVENNNQRQEIDNRNCLKQYSDFINNSYYGCYDKVKLNNLSNFYNGFIPIYDKVKDKQLEFEIFGMENTIRDYRCIYEYYSKNDSLKNTLTYNLYLDLIIKLTLNEGFSDLRTCGECLRDYIDMYKQYNNELPQIDGNFEGLQLRHDKLSREYRVKLENEKEQLFNQNQSWLKEKVLKDNRYKIVVPLESEQIKQEANMQNNCVASYIARVVRGETNIVFLRKTENLEKSYITIEIVNKEIVQAKRKGNQKIDNVDYNLLKEYAKFMNINIRENL